MERQTLDMIMETLGLKFFLPKVRDVAEQNDISPLTLIGEIIVTGCHAEQARMDCVKQRKKEKNQKKERNIYINNKEKKDKQDILSKLNLNTSTENSLSALVEKRQTTEKKKKINKSVQIPKAWVDAREKETVFVGENLVAYAEKQGYDWYSTKETFFAFVDFHQSKGSKFVLWRKAWQTWIRNDIRYHGKPITHSPGSVVQSYENKNPIKDLFKDD